MNVERKNMRKVNKLINKIKYLIAAWLLRKVDKEFRIKVPKEIVKIGFDELKRDDLTEIQKVSIFNLLTGQWQ